jgi:hypothetical protein
MIEGTYCAGVTFAREFFMLLKTLAQNRRERPAFSSL